MCNLYSITTNQAAIIALFRVINRYVGNLAPMPGVSAALPKTDVYRTSSQGGLFVFNSGFASMNQASRRRSRPLKGLSTAIVMEFLLMERGARRRFDGGQRTW